MEVPAIPAGLLADVVAWLRPLARLVLALVVGYIILANASKAAEWLSSSRPVNAVVYGVLLLVVASALLGAVDAIAFEATGSRLTGWGLEAIHDVLRRAGL